MLIKEVEIFSDKATEVAMFYESIGADVFKKEDRFHVKIGESELLISTSDIPWTYHFAYNIPFDQIENARDWLSYYTEIQPFQGEEIVNFPKWGANAIYFYDPAGNILELIGRKPLQEKGKGVFNFQSLINISEVGWPVDEVRAAVQKLGMPLYSQFGPAFSAVGDEEGLLIVVDGHEKKWMPNDDEIQFSPATLKILLNEETRVIERNPGQMEFKTE